MGGLAQDPSSQRKVQGEIFADEVKVRRLYGRVKTDILNVWLLFFHSASRCTENWQSNPLFGSVSQTVRRRIIFLHV